MRPPSIPCFRVSDPPSVTYDSSGNRLKEDIKDPQGTLTKTVSYQYDVLNRRTRVLFPDASYAEYTYDNDGNRLTAKDPNGGVTSYQYDSLSRLVATVQPGSITYQYDYDEANNIATVTDANSATSMYVYDDLGRVYQVISPDTGTTTYQYDPAGNRVSKTDARGITVNYAHDALNRLTLVNFPTDNDMTYTYDSCTNGKGKLCQVRDQAGTTSYAYSVKGELVQEDRFILGINYTTSYGYDENGNLVSMTYPSGRLVSYVYNLTDHVTTVTTTPFGGSAQTVASSIVHKPFGPVSSLNYGNGLARTLALDQQYAIVGIQTGAVQDVTYSRNMNGDVTTITNNLDPSKDKTFSYDNLSRLTGATGPWGTLAFTYDDVGNRLTYEDSGGTTNYSYQTGTNRLTGLSGAVSTSFGHDPSGNVVSDNTRSYVYNENNRLVEASDGIVLGEYFYSASEQRLVKINDGTTTVFHYDGASRLIGESSSSGAFFAEYIYLAGQIIAKAEDMSLLFVHSDQIGTPAQMSDGTGSVVWEIEARPFGDGTTVNGNADLNLRFPGQYFDGETGLHQNWWREFDADTGQYLTADPILQPVIGPAYSAGSTNAVSSNRQDGMILDALFLIPINLHSYQYAEHNPLRKLDNTGLRTCKSGRCPDCPGGAWTGFGGTMVYAIGIAQSITKTTLQCVHKPGVWTTFSTWCSVGIGGGFAGVAVEGVFCTGALCIEDFEGPSLQFVGVGDLGGIGVGGGFSTGGGADCTIGGAGLGRGYGVAHFLDCRSYPSTWW